MTDNYIKILEELEPFGINNKADLSPLFKEFYPKPSDSSETGVSNALTPYIHLLDEMVTNTHIKYDAGQNQNIGVDLKREQHWFEKPIKLSITSQGLDYLNNRLLTKSVLITNKRAVRNSNIQLLFSIATIAVAVVTAYLTYKYSEANDLKLRIEAIEKRIPLKTQNQDLKTIQTESIESTKKK